LQRALTQAESALSSSLRFEPDPAKPHDETTPLIQSTISKGARHGSRIRRKRASSVAAHGDATVTDAVLMVHLKLLFGALADANSVSTVIEGLRRYRCAVLGQSVSSFEAFSSALLPCQTRSRFYNGGILFSSLVLVFIALVSLWSFLLLVKTKFVVSGSFGGTSTVTTRNPPLDNHSFRHGRSIIWSIYAHRYPHFYRCFSAGLRFRLHNLCGGEFEGLSSGDVLFCRGNDVIYRLSSWLLRTARRSFPSSILS